ncbi:hypothetical protein HYH02_008460 [Chlamydomonas schloesseri]|uniref:Pherophorin domain-containing protein n=1 Tax=Chlamydomonas schloesseri TaxID=2026947 RepID=A0A836B3T6_9CHLO|nr:hypothetical protein HYH02_008460 [Chlamydomonas schloesseri]|eukprot:KAG2446469.1 hypothetical protein HYH02_008460 [Chlamydomonas schloesseri]
MGRFRPAGPSGRLGSLVQLFAVVALVGVTGARAGGLVKRRSAQFSDGGPGLTPTYKCGSGSYEFGTVAVSFSSEYIAKLDTQVTYNLTVVRLAGNPAGPFPATEAPTTEVIGNVRLIANQPSGSLTVELTNKFGEAWPAGTVVSWASPLFYDQAKCTDGPDRVDPATPLENVLSPADAADGVKTTISFSLPWYRLSQPQVSPRGEAPCERVTQIAALLVKVYLPPALAAAGHRRALRQAAASISDYQGSVAWADKGSCDAPGYGTEPGNYYPFRLLDLDLACDCDIEAPVCGADGSYELRTPPGIFLPQPFTVNLLQFAPNESSSDRTYIPELEGYGFLTASSGLLTIKLVRKDGSAWPVYTKFTYTAFPDGGSSGGPASGPPGLTDVPPGSGGGGADAPPGAGGSDVPPSDPGAGGGGGGGDPVCAMPEVTDPTAKLEHVQVVLDEGTTEVSIEIPVSEFNLAVPPPDGGPQCTSPYPSFTPTVVGAIKLVLKAVLPGTTGPGLYNNQPQSYLGLDSICPGPPIVWATRLTFGCGCPKRPSPPPLPPAPPPSPPAPPPPAASGFPFCRCSKRKVTVSPWRVSQSAENILAGKDDQGIAYNEYCFAVGPFARCNATTAPCCNMTVKKLELLIRPECRNSSPRAIRGITANGMTISPSYSNHVAATGEDVVVLAITKLDKAPKKPNGNPIIDVCLRLDASSFQCGFADSLCDGRGRSGCLFSIFDAEDNNCCPTGFLDIFFRR